MNCVVIIAGREAVPVRAIPFVTGWQSFSPDAVAEGLAHRLDSGKLEGLTAYHIAGDGSISAMLPKEWDAPVDALAALSKKLKDTGGYSRPAWREQSILELPSHCFVWRDEFEKNVTGWWWKLLIIGERPGDKALNFTPRLPPSVEDAVFEGMPKGVAAVPHPPATEAELKVDDAPQPTQVHGEEGVERTPRKRAAIVASLGRKYPALASALDRPEDWAKACRVPREESPDGKQGWYYLERIEAECRCRYGGEAPATAADLSPAAQLRRVGR